MTHMELTQYFFNHKSHHINSSKLSFGVVPVLRKTPMGVKRFKNVFFLLHNSYVSNKKFCVNGNIGNYKINCYIILFKIPDVSNISQRSWSYNRNRL